MSEAGGLTLLGMDVRALAQSVPVRPRPTASFSKPCRRNSLRPVLGIDGFGDQDARAACDAFIRVEGCDADALADAAIEHAALAAGVVHGDDVPARADLLVGGGLDARPDLLRRLGERFRLRGNGPEIADVLADPPRWFELLGRLGIAHPPVTATRPEVARGWLLKHAASCGGLGVVSADASHATAPDAYFQRRVAGPVVSAIFLADGRDARIIGFNRLLCEAIAQRPYQYAGAIAWAGPSPEQQRIIRGWIERLTRVLALRGLNGIDLILPALGRHASAASTSDAPPLLLELNARPTATAELHAERLPGGAVHCHLEACDGRLPAVSSPQHTGIPRMLRGCRVLYAPHAITTAHGDWPAWSRDRPACGTRIGAGEPVCSVYAEGSDAVEVEHLLRRRAAAIFRSVAEPTADACPISDAATNPNTRAA
jgi:predicted ATP-grasp superfamily ATP-dependent carboligase